MRKMLVVCCSLMMAVIFASCKAGERTAVSQESSIAHLQAVQALNEGNFVIEADEFFIHLVKTDKPFRSSTRSFISFKNGRAIIKIYPDVTTPDLEWNNMETIGSGTIKFQKMNKRNGEMKYLLDIVDDNKRWKSIKATLILYRDSNKCYLQLFNKNSGYKIVSINGQVCKYQED